MPREGELEWILQPLDKNGKNDLKIIKHENTKKNVFFLSKSKVKSFIQNNTLCIYNEN